jgi:AbiV family abortive infection protein
VNKKGYHLAYDASRVISDQYIGLSDRDEYNAAVFHVYELLNSASVLFFAKHYAPSVFVSITVFEEIAKIKSGHMRSWSADKKEVRRNKDPLFQHTKKHKIAVDPIYLLGDRLANSIGKDRAEEFFAKYESGEYSALREQSLYFARDKQELHIPSQKIDSTLSAENLLVALEIFSDEFFGMTAEASEISHRADVLYAEVEQQFKNSYKKLN